VEQRLPNVPELKTPKGELPKLTEEMMQARESFEKRFEEYGETRIEQFRIKENKARRESKLNTEFARKLREDY